MDDDHTFHNNFHFHVKTYHREVKINSIKLYHIIKDNDSSILFFQ